MRESHDDSHLQRPVRHQCSRVDGKNINAFVDETCDLLSLDTDGADYRIFKGLKAKPKIVIVEIDSSYLPDFVGFNPDGAGTYRNTVELGVEKGYFLLCHTGNLVFVANEYRDLFPGIEGDGLRNAELYFNRGWLREDACSVLSERPAASWSRWPTVGLLGEGSTSARGPARQLRASKESTVISEHATAAQAFAGIGQAR